MQSPAPFQNTFKLCAFLPQFSNILPFLGIFFVHFLKNAIFQKCPDFLE